MGKDVKQTLEELKKLYQDGKITIAKFKDAYDEIVPIRSQMLAEPYCIQTKSGIPKVGMTNPLKKPEHPQLATIAEEADKYTKKWMKSVDSLLSSLEQIRFHLQFENPKQKSSIVPKIGETTLLEKRLYNSVKSLSEHHAELRQIIIELEKATEIITTKNTVDIEPAYYDKRTRTIFFAGEAIRFKKDATYSPAVCELLFNHPEKKIWQLKDLLKLWDEVAYYGELNAPNDWHKVYEAIKRTNDRVKDRTGIDDLFLFSTTSVRLNPAYLKTTKKSQ